MPKKIRETFRKSTRPGGFGGQKYFFDCVSFPDILGSGGQKNFLKCPEKKKIVQKLLETSRN